MTPEMKQLKAMADLLDAIEHFADVQNKPLAQRLANGNEHASRLLQAFERYGEDVPADVRKHIIDQVATSS